MSVRYPEIEVQLTGNDGNAFAILGNVRRAMVRAKVPESDIKEFMQEAMDGDYNQLLVTCMEWVNVS